MYSNYENNYYQMCTFQFIIGSKPSYCDQPTYELLAPLAP